MLLIFDLESCMVSLIFLIIDENIIDFNNNISVLNILYKFPLAGVAAQGIICHLRVRKDVIKLQQIISKHKQAFIPTAI